jgi:hypothetical protein
MAYMSQEKKNELSPAIKAVLKKYNVKASISVMHHSTLVVTISESEFDIGEDYFRVNEYRIDSNYTGRLADFLSELKDAMMTGNHDNSDWMTDYHDVGWYVCIQFGRWNKPYRVLAAV